MLLFSGHPNIHEVDFAPMHPVFHRENLIAEKGWYLHLGAEGQEIQRPKAILNILVGSGSERRVVGLFGVLE